MDTNSGIGESAAGADDNFVTISFEQFIQDYMEILGLSTANESIEQKEPKEQVSQESPREIFTRCYPDPVMRITARAYWLRYQYGLAVHGDGEVTALYTYNLLHGVFAALAQRAGFGYLQPNPFFPGFWWGKENEAEFIAALEGMLDFCEKRFQNHALNSGYDTTFRLKVVPFNAGPFWWVMKILFKGDDPNDYDLVLDLSGSY